MGNTKIRPIAMKCNQEQFEAVKWKLNNIQITDNDINFMSYPYLVNTFKGDGKTGIGTYDKSMVRVNQEIHETWNEEIFLNACGIETEPTYTITKEQILELENGFTLPKLKQWFPDVFEVKLEAGKWYWRDEDELAVYNNGKSTYGFLKGFFICDMLFSFGIGRKATEQEVFKALKNEAVKRGFVEGVYIKKSGINKDFNHLNKPISGKFYLNKIDFTLDSDNGFGYIFKNGKWAEIIPTITKKEAEDKLNCKIV
jgi:hypothetical protein